MREEARRPWGQAGLEYIGKLYEEINAMREERDKFESEVEELKAKMVVAPVPEPEPKAVSNPWGRAGKPGSQRVAPPPAKKARFQPARGAVDAAAAVM